MSAPAETIKESATEAEIPVAEATAVGGAASAPVEASTGIITVDLEVGATDTYDFSGSPVQVLNVEGAKAGMYVHSIQVGPDLEVSHITDAARVKQLLDSNAQLTRQLRLSPNKTPLNQTDGFYYTVTLPTPASLEALQMEIKGFPPVVVNVSANSPLAGKIHPRQFVAELRIPGKPQLNGKSPGFTAYKVEQELKQAANTPGIQIVFKEVLVNVKLDKGSEVACDDCVIL
ncbi:expressed unknown protein [Seminavis robusta]|uniref:Uncharacterized protein n=1 Tax=Seminavis robusta TaxID=568900 RepID=A0A9N8EXR9_9STRA|nr:expressed unknown protein [Seminavis robusta]|eukprot:Sro2422_g327180.1 n/a (231) ;mRNA; f:6371-7063